MGLRIDDAVKKLPSGLIGIASSTMGRYREFDMSLNKLSVPLMSAMTYEVSVAVAVNFNNMCRKLLKCKRFEWLWILGDDHVLQPELLVRLLGRNVDIVAPLCLQTVDPFLPVIYRLSDEGMAEFEINKIVPPNSYYQMSLDEVKGKIGLIQVDACGNAGMLIRRNVIEKIGEDWHRVGWQSGEGGASDLYFCKKAVESGFKIHVDMDNTIGHISHMALWPVRNEENEYSAGFRGAGDIPDANPDKVWYF